MHCQLGNLTIHYDAFGQGKPVLILPGWGANALTMAYSLDPCFQGQAGWRRICLDLPGHGMTPAAEMHDWLDRVAKESNGGGP